MARNHFSKAGGPYFLNNGFTKHKEHHDHDDSHTHEHMSKTPNPISVALGGLLLMCTTIAITMVILHVIH